MAGSERAVIQAVAFAAGGAGDKGGGSAGANVGRSANAASLQVRIASPLNGSIIALDPDIPPKNQRMQFAATANGKGRWELDGKAIGAADRALSWFPMPGAHTLKLVGEKGEVLDEARFEVRGANLKAASR